MTGHHRQNGQHTSCRRTSRLALIRGGTTGLIDVGGKLLRSWLREFDITHKGEIVGGSSEASIGRLKVKADRARDAWKLAKPALFHTGQDASGMDPPSLYVRRRHVEMLYDDWLRRRGD